jgi:hypothetical protein
LAGAAALLLAFLGALSLGPARANAESLVRAARAVHALPVDRCYLVETERAAPADDSYAALTRSRVVRLRPRGDRFRIETESGQRLLHWGRDASGTIWLALSRHRGVRFESGEIPEALGLVCDVHSMRLETLLEDVLRDFDLRREEAAGSGGVVIRAELKAGREHPNLRSAVLELDVESKVIRRLVVDRQFAPGGRGLPARRTPGGAVPGLLSHIRAAAPP